MYGSTIDNGTRVRNYFYFYDENGHPWRSSSLHICQSISLVVAATLGIAGGARAEVRVERVRFDSHGENIVGALYLPEGASARNPAAALLVTGAWMTVKEQMPQRYAREMAQRGFIALAFDFRGWGESGGARRQYEDPQAKIADIEAATAYLAARPEVDRARLGGLGVCASSGYLVTAATRTPAIRSVALVAPWLQDAGVVADTYGGKEGIAKLQAAGDAAEAAYSSSKRQIFVPAASNTDERAIMFEVPYYTGADRGMIPAWRNEADLAFWRGWLSFDSIQAAARLRQPLLMVHSEAAAVPQGAHRFYAKLAAREKSERWLDNVTQFDFYDRDAPVKTASDAAAAHFRATLGANADAGAAR